MLIKKYNITYKNEVFSAVADGMKTQESCKEAWLCAVNANRNLLKKHENRVNTNIKSCQNQTTSRWLSSNQANEKDCFK